MSTFEVKINTTDDPSGVKEATLEAIKYTDALGKVAAQEEKQAANKAAKQHLAELSDEEKKAASAAYLLSQEQEKANKRMQDTGPAAAKGAMSMTDLWSSVQLAKGYFQMLQGAVDETVGKFVEYAGQVRDLSALSGANAEQTSRMIQMADDAQISYDELGKSLEFAAKKGLEPNIDMLARTSAEYLSLAPGVDRANFLFDTFGKKNAEMYKILELGPEAIKANAAAISDKLVLDEAAIQKAKEYTAAQDDLKDAIDGISIEIGEKYAPGLAAAAKATAELLSLTEKIQHALDQHAHDVTVTSNSYDEYTIELERAARASGLIVMGNGNLVTARGQLIQKNYLLTESEWGAARAAEAAAAGTDMTKDAVERVRDVVPSAAEVMDALAAAMEKTTQANNGLLGLMQGIESENNNYIDSNDRLMTKQAELEGNLNTLIAQGWSPYSQKVQDARKALEDNALAIQDLANAHDQAVARIVWDLYVQKLQADGFTDAEFNMALQAGLTAGVLDEKSVAMALSMDKTTTAAATAEGKVLDIGAAVAALQDKTITITTNYVGNNGGMPSYYADGGQYAAGEPRIVGEAGPELDIPDHSGTIIPNDMLGMIGGPGGSNQTIVLEYKPMLSLANAAELERVIMPIIQRALRRER
jgi:hypothetical protein